MRIVLTLLFVSAALAQYDPVVLWDQSGAGDSSRYGIVYALGDQNEDGFSDFAVWALGWGPSGQASETLAEFFYGGNEPSQIPYMTFRGRPDLDQRFYRFQTVGDLNGDGFMDWQIWRVPQSDPNQITFETYWGGPNADTIPDLVFHGPWTHDIWVKPARDFNGDGYDDLYMYQWSSGGIDFGQIYYGGNPMDTLPDWTRHSPVNYPQEALALSFGDVNGDGFSDFISPHPTGTCVYFGGAIPDTVPAFTWNLDPGWSEIVSSLNADSTDDVIFHGRPMRVFWGRDSLLSVPDYYLNFYGNCSPLWKLSLGDINNDGYGDMAVIDDGCNNFWGTLCLYLGHPWLNADPAVVIQGRTPPLNLVGINNATGLGDVNGDGIDDWTIGAFNADFDGFRGRAVVLAGDTSLRVATDPRRPELPKNFQVTVYPNPFNGSATIALALPPYSRHAALTVYNLLGKKVFSTELAVSGGTAVYRYDAGNLASGLYLLQVQSDNFKTTTKLMLLR